MGRAPIALASLAVIALVWIRASGLVPWAPLTLSSRKTRMVSISREATGTEHLLPSPPPPPPSSMAKAMADRVAASIAAEAASDLVSDFNRTCHPVPHAGFGGGAITWGMSFKTMTALDCCSACAAHARICAGPQSLNTIFYTRHFEGRSVSARCAPVQGDPEGTIRPCNIWLYCPEARCWSRDRWNHTFGECWLKYQRDSSRPRAGAYGNYPSEYRQRHRTAPQTVQWMSGSLTEGDRSIVIDGPNWR